MRVCVCGLWHLGSVTAACLSEHFTTVGWDPDSGVVKELKNGRAPLQEPGLNELIQAGLDSDRLSFSDSIADAVSNADVIWVTFDTPVDADDVADTTSVMRHVETLFPHLSDGSIVLISSQLPVGSTARLQSAFQADSPDRKVAFASSPENLRLGKALDAFRNPERIIVGTRDAKTREKLEVLFKPFCQRIEWMGVESAEMTKHAINAFLATSVTFINELAVLCERTGADAKEVERGLKSEARIGPKAYLSPGGAFAGGTLARDIAYLTQIGARENSPVHLFNAVRLSNDAHKEWLRRSLQRNLKNLHGKTIGILGLAYKVGTDTLRRSGAVELALWLKEQGADIRAFDPAITELPSELGKTITLCARPELCWQQADALVLTTEWPAFKDLQWNLVAKEMRNPLIVDQSRFLEKTLESLTGVQYVALGKSVG